MPSDVHQSLNTCVTITQVISVMTIFRDEVEQPFLINPLLLARDLTLYASIRFVSEIFPSDEPLNISPTADAVLDRDVEGVLLIDIWADPDGLKKCSASTFEVGRKIMALGEHQVDSNWAGAGLPFLMITMAQNVTGWDRYVIGVNDLGGW